MSTEARLDRLGLSHLADKPEELERELLRGKQEFDQAQKEANMKRKARLSAPQANAEMPETSSSRTNTD